MQKTKQTKQWILIGLALIWPKAYQWFGELYYTIIANTPLHELPFVQEQAQGNGQGLDAIFCGLMILLSIPLYHSICKQTQAQNVQVACTPKWLGKAVVIGFGLGGVSSVVILGSNFLFPDAGIAAGMEELGEMFTAEPTFMGYLWGFLSTALLGPIVEEIIFRGVLYRAVDWVKPGWLAVVVSGLYFGLWHGVPVQILYTTFIGLVLGMFYYQTRNLWLLMVAHIVNNFLVTLPPFMDTELVNTVLIGIKFICLIPTAYWMVQIVREARVKRANAFQVVDATE